MRNTRRGFARPVTTQYPHYAASRRVIFLTTGHIKDRSLSSEPVDFVVMHPEGTLQTGRFTKARSPHDALATTIPDLTSQGFGRLRTWFSDSQTSQPGNRLADTVISGMGYRHHGGWRGKVALTMAEDRATGTYPPLLREALDSIEELAATVTSAA